MENKLKEEKSNNFYVVGIGASAGGYEALETFFRNMPPDNGMAFIVIQHLSPDFKSLMAELLSKHTKMRVYRVEDGMQVEPNCVYLIPPKKSMTIFHSHLYLSEISHSQGLNLPINIFFRSLAEDKQDRAIGIILSGTGSDGTLGIRDIKGNGGMVMVQDIATSKFDGMPRSAISIGMVDFILAPEKMPEELIRFVEHIHTTRDETTLTNHHTGSSLPKILSLIKNSENIDFSYYKPTTIIRRIEKRMGINQIATIQEYISYMETHQEEVRILSRELLIGVTKFFRDTEAFNELKNSVIPKLVANRKANTPIRVWVVGCSTGEEAYSLAILFHEYLETVGESVDVKIFATDLDKQMVEQASHGIYPESILADISPDRLNKYFVRKEGSYAVEETIRKTVLFAQQNVISDPPFNKMDLITCRNLLIYLQPQTQKKILSLFHFSLNQSGYLFLGKSETIGEMVNQFKPLDQKLRIYQKIGVVNPELINNRNLNLVNYERRQISQGQKNKAETDRFNEYYKALMGPYEPAAILINGKNEPEYFFGDVNRYLRFAKGRMNLNIFKMIHDELSIAVGTACHKARQEKKEVFYRDILIKQDNQTATINLIVRPAARENYDTDKLFIIFEEVPGTLPPEEEGEVYVAETKTNQRVKDLENELQFTKENLQATVEELETSNEELQATNEELLASNEELQSTNEELQSVNEELITVNAEYQNKIDELTDLTNDYDNLLASTEVGTLFLDSDLNIRKFTPNLPEPFNLTESDIGRSISLFSFQNIYDDFLEDIKDVLQTGEEKNREIELHDAQWYLTRILPYKTAEDLIEGVVITFVDISDLKMMSDQLDRYERT